MHIFEYAKNLNISKYSLLTDAIIKVGLRGVRAGFAICSDVAVWPGVAADDADEGPGVIEKDTDLEGYRLKV